MNEAQRYIAKVFLLNKAALIAVSFLAVAFLPLGAVYKVNTQGALNLWAQWDGEAYLTIAQKGYVPLADGRTLYNFLPLYPFSIRLLGFLIPDLALAGFILSGVFALIAFYYLHRLTEKEFGKAAAKKAVVLLLFFPTAFFFSAIYTESLFLALVAASFYYARSGNWIYAGLLAAPLPFVRIVGLAFWIVLVVEYITQGGTTKKINPREALGFAAALAGVALFFVYSILVTGTVFGYANQQNLWTRAINSPHVALLNAFELILFRSPVLALYSAWNLSVLGFFAATLYHAIKKMRPSYAVYMFLMMILPLLSSTLEGFSRFILICFPSFMILAKFLNERSKFYLPLLVLSAFFLTILTARFVTGSVETVFG